MRTVLIALRLVAAACLVAVAAGVAATSLSATRGLDVIAVTGGSMEPSIPLGAAVVVAPVTRVEVGDVITYESGPGTLTTHRVTAVEGEGAATTYRTRGDANRSADAVPVPAASVRGLVRGDVPVLGYVLVALASPQGRLVLLGVPLLALLVDQLLVLARPVRGRRSAGSSRATGRHRTAPALGAFGRAARRRA